MLFHSSLWLIIKLIASLLLISHLIITWLQPFPTAPYPQLAYFMEEWTLIDRQGNKLFYDRHRIILDGAGFLLIELTGDSPRKILTVFSDQLDKDEHRQLRLMEKIHRKKK